MSLKDTETIILDLARSHPAIQAEIRPQDTRQMVGYTGTEVWYEVHLSRGDAHIVIQSRYDWLRVRMYRTLFAPGE